MRNINTNWKILKLLYTRAFCTLEIEKSFLYTMEFYILPFQEIIGVAKDAWREY